MKAKLLDKFKEALAKEELRLKNIKNKFDKSCEELTVFVETLRKLQEKDIIIDFVGESYSVISYSVITNKIKTIIKFNNDTKIHKDLEESFEWATNFINEAIEKITNNQIKGVNIEDNQITYLVDRKHNK